MGNRNKKNRSQQGKKNWAEEKKQEFQRTKDGVMYQDKTPRQTLSKVDGRICINGVFCMAEETWRELMVNGLAKDIMEKAVKQYKNVWDSQKKEREKRRNIPVLHYSSGARQ